MKNLFNDITRFVVEDGLLKEDGNLVKMFAGHDLREILTVLTFKNYLNSRNLTEQKMSNYDNGMFGYNANTGLTSKDGKTITFKKDIIEPDVDGPNKLKYKLSKVNFDSIVKKIAIYEFLTGDKFQVKTTDGSSYEDFLVLNSTGEYEDFLVQGEGPKEIAGFSHRSEVDLLVNNTILDLSEIAITDDSITEGEYKSYPITDDALLVITFADNRIIHTDISDGLYASEGLFIKNKTLYSSRVINKVKVYYENYEDYVKPDYDINKYYKVKERYNDIVATIERTTYVSNPVFQVKTTDGSSYEDFLVKDTSGTNYEKFLTQDSGSGEYTELSHRSLVNIEVNSKTYDLSKVSYTDDSVEEGVMRTYPITNDALLEILLDNKKILLTDVSDGVDNKTGITISNKVITSTETIKSIKVYYETFISLHHKNSDTID